MTRKFRNFVSLQLAVKEIWRNKLRFLAISAVIALITVLILFLAALGEGLASGNREYIEKLNGEILLFEENVALSVSASRLNRSLVNDVRRVDSVAAAGAIGFSSVFVQYEGAEEALSVSLFGVEPGRPGDVPVLQGQPLGSLRDNEAVIDKTAAARTGLGVGDTLHVESKQGTDEQLYELRIVGVSDGRQYFIQPAVIVPLFTWDRIRPKAGFGGEARDLAVSMIGVKLEAPAAVDTTLAKLEAQVNGIDAADLRTAYESAPGYQEQASTINTQRAFTLLIGILVVGGFFQIQTLQKVAQIGVLKALGASTLTVALATILQIVLVNLFGVLLGGVATLGLAAALPPQIPIVFQGVQAILTVATLLLIGPLSGLISVRALVKVEPLTALGLAA